MENSPGPPPTKCGNPSSILGLDTMNRIFCRIPQSNKLLVQPWPLLKGDGISASWECVKLPLGGKKDMDPTLGSDTTLTFLDRIGFEI